MNKQQRQRIRDHQAQLVSGMSVRTPDGIGVIVIAAYCHPYHNSSVVRLANGDERMYPSLKLKALSR